MVRSIILIAICKLNLPPWQQPYTLSKNVCPANENARPPRKCMHLLVNNVPERWGGIIHVSTLFMRDNIHGGDNIYRGHYSWDTLFTRLHWSQNIIHGYIAHRTGTTV